MGFSLSSITDKITSSAKGTVRAIDKTDPTGISSTMLTGGLNIASGSGGGMIGGLVNKAIGKGGDSGGGAAPQGRKRYQRKERNQWKSKRQLKFEADKKKKPGQKMKKMVSGLGNAAKMIASGVKK